MARRSPIATPKRKRGIFFFIHRLIFENKIWRAGEIRYKRHCVFFILPSNPMKRMLRQPSTLALIAIMTTLWESAAASGTAYTTPVG